MGSSTIVFSVGALLIFIFALDRFNTPPTNRSSTTWFRYYAAALIYVGLFEFTYGLISQFPALQAYLLALLPQANDALRTHGLNASDPEALTVGLAMLLSVLVPKLPGLAKLDRTLRIQLQRAAAIPYEARRFAREIQKAQFHPDDTLKARLRTQWTALGIDTSADAAQSDLPPEYWSRLAAMMIGIERWESDRNFTAFLQDRAGQYQRLKSRYERSREMARTCFQLQSQTTATAGEDSLHNAVDKFRGSFESETQDLIREASDLLSHGLLKCCVRTAARQQELRGMGLRIPNSEHYGMTADQTTMLFGALLLVLLLNFVAVSDRSQGELLVRVVMIAIIYTAAVICAVVPKQHWQLFQRSAQGDPPAFGYALSGAMAVTFAIVVSLSFNTLIYSKSVGLGGAFGDAWHLLWSRVYPWLLMTFVTSVSTAAVIDSRRLEAIGSEARRRWTETALLALIIGVTSVVVRTMLAHLPTADPATLPPAGQVVLMSTTLGAVIGHTVPHWYRRSPTPAEHRASLMDS